MTVVEPYGTRRSSAQRRLIASIVESRPGAFTVDGLARAVGEERPSVGLATVYRAVAAMEASGWITAAGSRDGQALYVRCSNDDHHHHLVCTSCGSVADIDCGIEAAAQLAAQGPGFVLTRHEVELYGLCPACGPEGCATGAPDRREGAERPEQQRAARPAPSDAAPDG